MLCFRNKRGITWQLGMFSLPQQRLMMAIVRGGRVAVAGSYKTTAKKLVKLGFVELDHGDVPCHAQMDKDAAMLTVLENRRPS